ncbi:hypothetical protein [Gemmatimonas groenlandica]|uniref:Uncharacterized protein n=1 Tax=Gemmatimonas groenlandica TaxID=2732249 RepID=A0A6M4IS01_9BACT|nr:hypothetical protein [Gemmatimonas groenlandica]QJR37684.1 hypothetical protein HKW67_20250 [Gemmatimonas groenlandica]
MPISLEPTERGEQLLLTATNELADVLNAFSLLLGVVSLLMAAVVVVAGKPQKAIIMLALFGGMSLAAFGANIIRLPRWPVTAVVACPSSVVHQLTDPADQGAREQVGFCFRSVPVGVQGQDACAPSQSACSRRVARALACCNFLV